MRLVDWSLSEKSFDLRCIAFHGNRHPPEVESLSFLVLGHEASVPLLLPVSPPFYNLTGGLGTTSEGTSEVQTEPLLRL